MPKVTSEELPIYDGPGAVEPFAGPLGEYVGRTISAHHGLQHLGANVETLMPGAASSHRHWHERTDELVILVTGELTLIDEAGETLLRAGEIAVFPAGEPNGHCLVNHSDVPATFLVVGTRDAQDRCHYPDLGLVLHPGGSITREDGSAAEPERRS